MTYTTRKALRTLLPIVIILLAIGILLGLLWTDILQTEHVIKGGICSILSYISYIICLRVDRHKGNAAEEAFLSAFLIAAGSYTFPAILFFQILLWGILIYRQAFDGRTFIASLLGCLSVLIMICPMVYIGWVNNPWIAIFSPQELWAGMIVGLFWIAWISITIVRQTLHER